MVHINITASHPVGALKQLLLSSQFRSTDTEASASETALRSLIEVILLCPIRMNQTPKTKFVIFLRYY